MIPIANAFEFLEKSSTTNQQKAAKCNKFRPNALICWIAVKVKDSFSRSSAKFLSLTINI